VRLATTRQIMQPPHATWRTGTDPLCHLPPLKSSTKGDNKGHLSAPPHHAFRVSEERSDLQLPPRASAQTTTRTCSSALCEGRRGGVVVKRKKRNHAQTHTPTHTNSRTHTHTRTDSRTHTHTCARKHTHTHSRTHAKIKTTHTQTHIYTLLYKPTNRYARARARVCVCVCVCVCLVIYLLRILV
jgi:hypothetical protein